MRIYSKFKDYYDPALRDFESEATPVYERSPLWTDTEKNIHLDINVKRERAFFVDENRLLKIDPNTFTSISTDEYRYKPQAITLHMKVIGFCGKLYPVYTDEIMGNPIEYRRPDYKNKAINIYRKLNPEAFVLGHTKPYYTRKGDELTFSNYDEIENSPFLKSLFLKFHVPAFVTDFLNHKVDGVGYDILLNPRLSDFGFQKIFSPWEAMQEINMFFGNDLVQDKTPPMPVGSDKIIAESKGFDKWSFRKPPSK